MILRGSKVGATIYTPVADPLLGWLGLQSQLRLPEELLHFSNSPCIYRRWLDEISKLAVVTPGVVVSNRRR